MAGYHPTAHGRSPRQLSPIRSRRDDRQELSSVLDYAADAARQGRLSAAACHIILVWWLSPQLTPRDLVDLGVPRLRLREAIGFLQSMPDSLGASLAQSIPAARPPVLLHAEMRGNEAHCRGAKSQYRTGNR